MTAPYLFKMLTSLTVLTMCLQHQDISEILPIVATISKEMCKAHTGVEQHSGFLNVCSTKQRDILK
jgi:hypothetical protein